MEQEILPGIEAHEEKLAQDKANREARIWRQQLEEVFGLTGGELEDKPWESKNPESGIDRTFHHWYEGVPDYCERDYRDEDGEFRTVVTYGEPSQELVDEDGTRWFFVTSMTSSGETECPWKNCDVEEGEDPRPCELCDAKEGEEHGYIYIGDGYCEAIYKTDNVREVMES